MGIIEIEGFEELEDTLKTMEIDNNDKKRAIRQGIKVIAKSIEKNSPIGKTGRLRKIKVNVKDMGLYVEGIAKSKAFYDVFQEFGTSEQKAHIGYFDRAVNESGELAIEAVGKAILGKIR